jgi:hypothetical protein
VTVLSFRLRPAWCEDCGRYCRTPESLPYICIECRAQEDAELEAKAHAAGFGSFDAWADQMALEAQQGDQHGFA